MERYLERHPSNSSLNAKRPAENETDDWRAPKRYATNKSPRSSGKIGLQNTFKDLPVDTEAVSESHPKDTVTTSRKTTHVPPIIMEMKKDWTHKTLKDIVSGHINRYHMQYRNGSKVAIMCHNIESHKLLKEGLKKDNMSFVTYTRKDEKTPKVVIKGLPDSVGTELPSELNKLGFQTTSVTKLKSKHGTYLPCPPFLVQLSPGADIVKFKQIKYLFNCVISIEKFKPNRSQGTQCYRCQRFGHSSQNCNLPARCVKCTEAHTTAECPKKERETPARCCNCQGEHPANYRNCSARLAYLERQEKKRDIQRKYPLAIPSVPQATVKATSDKTWADITKRNAAPTILRPPVDENPVHTSRAAVTQVDDPVTKEMLHILLTIKKLKSQFLTCQSQLEKVTLILSHLGPFF